MASSSTLGDIEERFFQCALCSKSLDDPKVLSCLHRYCRKCMQMVLANKRGRFNCPLCNEECVIPPDGVDGFRTDFFIKSVLAFLQLQRTYKEDNVKRCRGCKETKNITGYCFKCKSFLCQQCYQFHLDNDMLEEHRPHILDLQTVDVRSLTMEKLTPLTGDPRCAVHIKRTAEMCCETCENLPICVACVFGKHKGHVIHEVQILAKIEEEKLEAVMSKLDGCRDKLYELPKRVARVREALAANIKKQLEEARSRHKKESERIFRHAEQEKDALQKQREQIVERYEKECDQVRKEQEEELQKMKEKYNNILGEKERSFREGVGKVDKQMGMMNDECSARVEQLKKDLHSYEEKVKASQVKREEGISDVDDHSRHRINRYENFTVTARTVHAFHDEWTEAQCLPAITAAGVTLIEDVKKEFGDLESLSKTGVSFMMVKKVIVTDSHESVVDIKGIGERRQVDSITSSSDGHIIVTGRARGGKSHITVIDREGRVVRQDHIQGSTVTDWRYGPNCYCHSLSQHITVCASNQVGLYDNRNGMCVSKNIKDISIDWPGYAACVVTDTSHNIYVMGSNVVLVLDDQLNYLRTLKLPGSISGTRDIAVHGNNLIVCDSAGGRSYAVTMQGEEAQVIHQLTKLIGYPLSVCTDSKQYIYMLWPGSGMQVAQYSQDGRQLLTIRKVDNDARCVTTMKTEEGEKLLIATQRSRKLYTFGLLEEE